jgi:CII-binding regulator of phage lambda lysogenization HflD
MGKKKGGKKKAASEPGDLTAADEVNMLQFQKLTLERELARAREMAQRAITEKRTYERALSEIRAEFKEETEGKYEITKNMTRQYKCMQENLLKQITEAHHTINTLKLELDKSHQALDNTKDDMRKALADKDKKIAGLNKRMEEMANEFGDMLKETLEKMRDRIEVTNAQFSESDTGARIIRKLENA